MLGKTRFVLVLAVASLMGAIGCQSEKQTNAQTNALGDPMPAPIGPDSVVKNYARLVTTGYLPVQGYGVVIGLGRNGSTEIPGALRGYLTNELARRDLGSWREGTEPVSPLKFLRDPDTAIVEVRGAVPPGAPVGSRFDLYVEAMPRTGTTTLDGGILMPLDLRLAGAWDVSRTDTHIWGEGGGSMFLSPYLDPDNPKDAAKFRSGKVIGGGKVTRPRIIHLQLLKTNYSQAFLIKNRINSRFTGTRDTAVGKSGSTIELNVPVRYRHHHQRFLDLVLHLPLSYDIEGQILRIAEKMKDPSADHNALSLTWEAAGKQSLTQIKSFYHSPNPFLSYYSARAGMRLGDRDAVDTIIRFALEDDSPMQVAAVEELGYGDPYGQAGEALRKLLDSSDEHVRTAAYESLLRMGDTSCIKRMRIAGNFVVDVVESRGQYAIYATQTDQPKIVIFGDDMAVAREVFYRSPDGMVTVSTKKPEDSRETRLMVYRRIPRGDNLSEPFLVGFDVAKLVKTMGSRPDPDEHGNIPGLGLTYGQVISTLHGLCRRGHIPGKFILQRPLDLRNLTESTPTMGRPDMPSS
ncbi:MAG: flagellar basal body P-ring protein FlgI [Phycisphaerae bacterium]